MRLTPSVFLLSVLIVCSGCAATDEKQLSEEDRAIEDFIALHELEESDSLRTGRTDGWSVVTERFIVYEGRNRQNYLVRFVRDCYELFDNTRIVADVRYDDNVIRSRFDTIRGCRIDTIYTLTDGEAEELKGVGASNQRRN